MKVTRKLWVKIQLEELLKQGVTRCVGPLKVGGSVGSVLVEVPLKNVIEGMAIMGEDTQVVHAYVEDDVLFF